MAAMFAADEREQAFQRWEIKMRKRERLRMWDLDVEAQVYKDHEQHLLREAKRIGDKFMRVSQEARDCWKPRPVK